MKNRSLSLSHNSNYKNITNYSNFNKDKIKQKDSNLEKYTPVLNKTI